MKEHVQNYEIWTASYSCIQFVTARCYTECGYATVYYLFVRPSVRPSLCNVQVPYRDDIGWNASKIISWPNSFKKPPLWLAPTWAIWCTFIRSITTTVNSH